MSLDVLSENGQLAVKQSRRALELLGCKYVETKQDTTSDIDGFFLNDANEVIACYEIKSRNNSLDDLENKFNDEWLITYDKIIKGAVIAKALQIPFYGVLYLVKDDTTLLIKIAGSNGEFIPNIRIERTKTQATCNGGTANRVNAYINMRSAKEYSENS